MECANLMLTIQSDSNDALLLKAHVLSLQKKYKESFKYYSKSADLYPNNEMAWLGKTRTSHHLKNYEDALKYIKKVIKINDTDPAYFYSYSNYLNKLRYYKDALKMINRSLYLFPKEENYAISKNFYLKGRILVNLDKIDEAEENFKIALDNALKSVKWRVANGYDERPYDYCYIARLLEYLNMTNEAIEYYEDTLKLDSKCLEAKNRLKVLKS